MTCIALIGDSHFDESPGGRFDECVRIHEWIVEDLEQRDVDLIVHSGDVFERRSTPRERRAVADWLRTAAEIAPVVMVRGNHDALGDLLIFERLRTKHPIVVEEAARVHVVAGVAVGCLAWPRKGAILAMLGRDVPQETAAQVAVDELRNVIRGLGLQMEAHEGPRVLLAHAMVRGSRTSTGQPLVGCDFELGLEDLALARADAYLLGHIHMPQEWDVEVAGRAPVIYPGSPRRTAFGEVEEKGYVLLDIGPDRDLELEPDAGTAQWERIPTPCAPMLLLEGEYVPENTVPHPDGGNPAVIAFEGGRPAVQPGAEVRVRYAVESDYREQARAAAAELKAELLEEGAAVVKVEEQVVATVRARAPEVAAAATVPEKLQAYWRARGDEFDAERCARLLSKAGELEEAVRDAA